MSKYAFFGKKISSILTENNTCFEPIFLTGPAKTSWISVIEISAMFQIYNKNMSSSLCNMANSKNQTIQILQIGSLKIGVESNELQIDFYRIVWICFTFRINRMANFLIESNELRTNSNFWKFGSTL